MQNIGSKLAACLMAAALAVTLWPATPAHAKEPFCLGEVMAFAGPFCPKGWQEADGTLLSIEDNASLYSIMGTLYGGDGRRNFALPDLRGREVVHVGDGPGVAPTQTQGAKIGSDRFTISTVHLPSHNHAAYAGGDFPFSKNPRGKLLSPGTKIYQNDTTTHRMALSADMIGNTGGGQPITKRSPAQVLRYCVATLSSYNYCPRN